MGSKRKAKEETLEIERKLKEAKKLEEKKNSQALEDAREKKKLEESLKKTTEEALDAMEKMIIQESLKKKTSEDIVTIKDSVKISKTCWNCFDDKCRSHMTNIKTKKKKLKNKKK